ncbi:MAG: hypothetical protein HC802_22740, partial [Caldilineaceae bacterium]|nr:hypothetical protein [Caldilineaceae bacterium]
MLRKILVANRGEIAVRILRACREMGISTVAVYSDADTYSLHTTLADEAVHIGAAPPAESYLNGDRLVDAALRTACDAVHPGYGFLSESADFAAQVIGADLTWIGPSPEVMRSLGDKISARTIMAATGLSGCARLPGQRRRRRLL